MDPWVVGSLGGVLIAVITGIVLKLTDWYLGKNQRGLATRKDLREELDTLHDRIEVLEKETSNWRVRFDALQVDYDGLSRKYTQTMVLQSNYDELLRRFAALTVEVATLRAQLVSRG